MKILFWLKAIIITLAIFLLLILFGCRSQKNIKYIEQTKQHDTVYTIVRDTITVSNNEIVYKLLPKSDSLVFTNASQLHNTLNNDNYSIKEVEVKSSDLSILNNSNKEVTTNKEKVSQIEQKEAKIKDNKVRRFPLYIMILCLLSSITFLIGYYSKGNKK